MEYFLATVNVGQRVVSPVQPINFLVIGTEMLMDDLHAFGVNHGIAIGLDHQRRHANGFKRRDCRSNETQKLA